MEKSRSSEEQIIGILTQGKAGIATGELCRSMGSATRSFTTGRPSTGPGSKRSTTAEAGGRREPEAEVDCGGPGAGLGDAEGSSRKKMVEPGAKRRTGSPNCCSGMERANAAPAGWWNSSAPHIAIGTEERAAGNITRTHGRARRRAAALRLPAHHRPAAAQRVLLKLLRRLQVLQVRTVCQTSRILTTDPKSAIEWIADRSY